MTGSSSGELEAVAVGGALADGSPVLAGAVGVEAADAAVPAVDDPASAAGAVAVP